jgi:hypothetical protein
MPADDRTPVLTPTPLFPPAELAGLAHRLAMRSPRARDANTVALIKDLDRLRTRAAGRKPAAPPQPD